MKKTTIEVTVTVEHRTGSEANLPDLAHAVAHALAGEKVFPASGSVYELTEASVHWTE